MSASVAGWIAIGAAAVAVAALGLALAAFRSLGRVREGQKVLLGGGRSDLVDFAVSLQGRVDELHRALDAVRASVSAAERRMDESVAKTAIVRYDAYADRGGHQSASVALLDSARTGIVLSAIQGRDYARIYIKELDRGHASIALSPEEQEAVDRAMST
jgi:uncharacterized protein DUF4446